MSAFNHAAHLRLAIDCLDDADSFDAAVDRIAALLRQKALDAGHPEKYHHTLTVFWMRMVARLLDPALPRAYYSEGLLASDAARAGWVAPDLEDVTDAATDSADSSRHAPDRLVSR